MSEEAYSTTFEEIVEAMPGRILPNRYRIDAVLSIDPYTATLRTIYEPKDQVVNFILFKVKTHENDYQYKRFIQEAKRLSNFKHPNLVQLIDFGLLEEGIPYIVTEHVPGPTLEDVLNRTNRIDPDQMVVLFSQISRAIQYGHEHGVLHEGLKPSRIILFDDAESGGVIVKVNGLGLMALDHKLGVQLKTPMERQTYIGTAAYMSPEQCLQDKPMDGRSDVYSLGCMMYECLGGEPPFIANDVRDVLKMQVSSAHKPLSVLRSDLAIPKRLVSLVDKCLEKDHTRRYQFVRDIQSDLERDIDPSEREQHTQIPEGITKAQQRVKESFEIPVKQLIFLFGGLLAIVTVGYLAVNTVNFAGQFADMGIWKAKLDSGTKALQEGRIADAGKDLEESVKESKKFKDGDSRKAISLNQEAHYFVLVEKNNDAIGAIKEAQAVETAAKLTESPLAAESLMYLSTAYLNLGKLGEAETAATQSVSILEKDASAPKDDLFKAYLQALRVYTAEKKVDAAKGLLVKLKACVPNDAAVSQTTEVKQAEALVDMAANKTDNAIGTLQAVLGERQEKIGLDSMLVVQTMMEMGKSYIAAKNYEKAIATLKTAYDNNKKYFSEDTPSMANICMLTGSACEQAGKMDEAEKQYRSALETSEKIWGERHKERLPYIDNFGRFLRKTGRGSAAEVYEQEAREIRDPNLIPKIAR